jgi:pimeloyl-ACP methyl ester carboxylesterase
MSTFTYKNKEIYYIVDGAIEQDKPVIVLLNGIMMSTVSWDGFKDAFSKQTTLLRFDMLDQGQSSRMDKQYKQDIQVDLLYELLHHLDIKKANIVGISYGASIALQFAIKHPTLVEKLVIANAVAKTSDWLKAIGDGWNQVAETRNGLAYYNITIPYIYSPQFYTTNIAWMEQRKKLLVPLFSNPDFLDQITRLTVSAETHDTRSKLHTIQAPTLIISGEMDFLTPLFEQQYIQQQIQDSRLIVFPRCGHASMYEQPELFISSILGFIVASDIPTII